MFPFGIVPVRVRPVVVVGTPRRGHTMENVQRGRVVGQVEGYAAAMRDLNRGRSRSRSRGRGLPRITYSSPTRTRDRSSSHYRSRKYDGRESRARSGSRHRNSSKYNEAGSRARSSSRYRNSSSKYDGGKTEGKSKSKSTSTSDSKAVTQDAYAKYKHYKAKHEDYRARLQAGPEGEEAEEADYRPRSGFEYEASTNGKSKSGSKSSYHRDSRYAELERELRYKDAEVNKYRIEKDEWRREQALQRQREENWRREQEESSVRGRGRNFDPSRMAAAEDRGSGDEVKIHYRKRYVDEPEDDRVPFYPPPQDPRMQRGGRVRFQQTEDERRERRDY